ncbi:MAG TPA: hypothetical protein VFV94_04645 [Polyangiaceae bacterium]|nr:hypothetical protein [Polyangiaceae bacterium]
MTLLGAGWACSTFSLLARADPPPPAQVGFQMALRTGYAVPLGKAEDDLDMSDFASGQVPIFVEVGGKPIKHLFLGGYMGFGFGGPAGFLKEACNGRCSAASFRLGIEGQLHMLPAALANPWLGYGIGLESVAVGTSGDDSIAFAGVELARFSAGVDFRLTEVFGVGPFVDFSMGNYSSISLGDVSVDIPHTTLHEWLTLGARFVFFP